MIFAQTLKPFS
jgi:hypothetical protein